MYAADNPYLPQARLAVRHAEALANLERVLEKISR